MIFGLTSHKIFLSEVDMDDVMNKFEMSEEDIRMRFITPAILKRGWNLNALRQRLWNGRKKRGQRE